MCQYSTYVTLAICADVQRTGDPSACKRQTTASAARATAPAKPLDLSALDRHLDLICGAIDERRAEEEPIVASAAAPVLGATDGFDGSRKGPGRKGPRALVRARELAKGAVGRISKSLSLASPRLHLTALSHWYFTSSLPRPSPLLSSPLLSHSHHLTSPHPHTLTPTLQSLRPLPPPPSHPLPPPPPLANKRLDDPSPPPLRAGPHREAGPQPHFLPLQEAGGEERRGRGADLDVA